jgi:NTE family protein
MDGGVAYQAPFQAAVSRGATRIFVLPTGYSCAQRELPRRAMGLAMHALNMLTLAKLVGAIQHFATRVELQVVPALCPLRISPLDFSHTRELIDRSDAQTGAWLAAGGGQNGAVPAMLLAHDHDASQENALAS